MAKDKQNNLFIILVASAVILLSLFIIFYETGGSMSRDQKSQVGQSEYPPMQDSNNVEDIEEDLQATELENIDQELIEIEAELETAY